MCDSATPRMETIAAMTGQGMAFPEGKRGPADNARSRSIILFPTGT